MHPVIRLICFLLLVVGLVATNNIAFIILIIIFIYKCQFSSLIQTLKRLRWLFLSILFLNLSANILDIVNLVIAIEKIIILIAIVIAAHLLLITTTTQEIIAALQWWLLPLTILGFPTERFAVRIALVLDTVQTAQKIYTNTSSNISDKMAELFAQVFTQANTTPLVTLEIPELSMPPLWQWIYPLIMLILILNDYL